MADNAQLPAMPRQHQSELSLLAALLKMRIQYLEKKQHEEEQKRLEEEQKRLEEEKQQKKLQEQKQRFNRFLRSYLIPAVQVLLALSLLLVAFGAHAVEASLIIPFKLPEISSLPLFFQIGPFTLFVSPLSLLPFALPAYVPFRCSYLAISLLDSTRFPDSLFMMYFYPSLYIYLPPLSSLSLHSLPPVTLCLITCSFTLGYPIQIVGTAVYISLWSLLKLKFSDMKAKLVPFPGIRKPSQTSDTGFSAVEAHDLEQPSIEPQDFADILSEPQAEPQDFADFLSETQAEPQDFDEFPSEPVTASTIGPLVLIVGLTAIFFAKRKALF